MTAPAHTLAPHVEPAWRDAFVVELRMHDVPGGAIGEALGEVEAYCADSGDDARSAFGEPAAYARELAAALPTRRRRPLRDIAAIVTQTAGVMGVVWSAPPWLHGEDLVVGRGAAVTVALILLVAVMLYLAPPRVLSWFTRARWWQAGIVGTAVTGALAALTALVPDAPMAAPSASLVVVSALLLVAGAVALHLSGATDDPIRTPDDADTPPTPRSRLTSLALSVALPLVAVLVAGALSLLPR
ncbi:hypothetical protein Cfla_3144 [Cellulomonas flavigena DSM 20109]|uniref:Uncharacterized protein n=1 Tax=Cellulomonas flavigena (strain ATCC 482 / DSM 20109 / BCRC 11376 / JCM 18109 / NBRC 3775 / NCIMB 8073 / NRS 134) TaxID=446466 RepID=D5ULS0_CELFN|nr:hypothetical protein [Cellulomonas flavigena]ADG76026.1 hypothetical protein Cfla_3144 [Cellulomonas flavigena DSM 20109]